MNLFANISFALFFIIILYPLTILHFRFLGGYSQKVTLIVYIISSVIIFTLMIILQPLNIDFS